MASSIDGNTPWILSLGEIEFYAPSLNKIVKVPTKDFIKVVNTAISKIESGYRFLAPYISHSKLMYVPYLDANTRIKTMAVDNNKNLWINMPFVYNNLNMDVNKVYGILFHELMHNFLNHIGRTRDIYSENMIEAMGPDAWEKESLKINLCQDIEVNDNMVADGIVSKDFWKKMGGQYDEKYMGWMWERILNIDGDKIFRAYTKSIPKYSEKMIEALDAIKECAKKLSDPAVSERDKEKARDELEKKLEDIYGGDLAPKDLTKKKKTIKSALQKIQKTNVKEYGNIGRILVSLIELYGIDIKLFSDKDIEDAIKNIDELEVDLIKNINNICDDLYWIIKDDFEDIIKKTMNIFKSNTIKIYKGKDTLSDGDINDLNDDIIDALGGLLTDEKVRKKIREDRRKKREAREEKAKKKREEMIEKAKKRHALYRLYHVFTNLANLNAEGVERISDETSACCETIYNTISPLLEKSLNDIVKNDVKPILEILDYTKECFYEDLIALYDSKVITSMTSTEIKNLIDDTFNEVERCFTDIYNKDMAEGTKSASIVGAIDSLRNIGKILRTKKLYRPSDEYKEAYMEEMRRLLKIRKELGKKGIREELTKLGM